MEFVVYVGYAQNHDIHYTGYTLNLMERFKSHNKLAHKGFTKKYRPWVLIHLEFFTTKSQAIKRERFLKSGKAGAFVKALPKIL